MGFMAGFGSSFSRSYEGARDRAFQERQDTFRLTYQDYMQRQQQYDEWNREDSKAVNKAKSLAEGYQLPDEAWTKVYDWVKSGVDDSTIEDRLAKGAFEVTSGVPAPEGAKGIDSEMSASGMAPAAPEQASAPQAQERDTGLFGSLLGNLAQKGKKGATMAEKRRSMAIDKIAANTGRQVGDVQKVMEGYQPTQSVDSSNVKFTPAAPSIEPDKFANPNEAYIEQAQAVDAATRNPTPQNVERARQADLRVKAIQDRTFMEAEAEAEAKGVSRNGSQVTIWDDQNGEYIGSGTLVQGQDGAQAIRTAEGIKPLPPGQTALPMKDDELGLRKEINTRIKEQKQTIQTQKQNAQAAFSTINVLNETIRKTNGEVLKPITAGITSKIEDWAIDIATGAQKLNLALTDPKNEGKEVVSQETFDSLLSAEQALLAADKTDLGAQKLLFETQKSILAYRIGMAMGQEGRGLAEAERKLFTDMASAGVTVDRFYDNMANLMMPIITGIDEGGKTILGEAGKEFKDQYGYVPGEFEYQPLAEELAKNPTTAPMWDEFSKRNRAGPAQIIKTGKSGDPVPQEETQVAAPVNKAEYDKLPSGTKYRHPDGTIKVKK